MLIRLLALLQNESLYTTGELAAALDVSRELIEEMLADLFRHGYLSFVSTACSTRRCVNCLVNKACQPAVTSGGRVYALNQLQEKK